MDLMDNEIKIINWCNVIEDPTTTIEIKEEVAKTMENIWIKGVKKGKKFAKFCSITKYNDYPGYYIQEITFSIAAGISVSNIGVADSLEMAMQKIDTLIATYHRALKEGTLGNFCIGCMLSNAG